MVLALLNRGDIPEIMPRGDSWPGPLVFLQLLVNLLHHLWRNAPPGLAWPLGALIVSHGVSFVQHYLVGKEYASATPEGLMGRSYGRIIVMHVAILASAAFVMVIGSPWPLLVVLVALKTAIDLCLHIRSHRTKEPERDATP